MVFAVKDKVTLVTGGASGIGLGLAKELLIQGAKGVTIADINAEEGHKIVQDLGKEFDPSRILFTLLDVRNSAQFENAFKETIDKFKHIDIVVNNAGICTDALWEKEVDINLKGTINGMILAMEKYLRYHKQGEEAVIVNTSSNVSCFIVPTVPIYSATKSAIATLTRCWGAPFHYDRVKVRVLAICPGVTNTPVLLPENRRLLMKEYEDVGLTMEALQSIMQSTEFLAKQTIHLIEKAPNGSIWVIEESKPAYQYITPDKDEFQNNILN